MAKEKKIDYFEIVRTTKPSESFDVKELRKRITKATYATPSQYARLSGVSRQAIHDRIKSGALETTEQKDFSGKKVKVINLKKFPPSKGRK